MELDERRLAELAEWFFNPEAAPPPGIVGTKEEVASECFNQLFLKAPEPNIGLSAIRGFRDIIQEQLDTSSANLLDYNSLYPKYEFLRYLSHDDNYVFHGSKNPNLTVLEPREQIDWNGNALKAVFGTRDVIWPLYFALLDRHVLSGSIRNGCFIVERLPSQWECFYFFSVNRESLHSNIWSDGFIYILSGKTFYPTTSGTVHFDEWASEEPVPVVAKLPVSPSDFPFLHQVSGHEESESIFRTWLRYKERIKAG